MGVEYQRFDGKEYVSLRRYYNLQCKCKALEQENKKLKSDLAYERTMLDNVKAEYENLQEINEKLKEKTEKLEKELSAVYKAYHTAMGVDYNNDEDLYTIEDIEGNNVE